MKEWTSDRVIKMVDVTGGFFGMPGLANYLG